MNRRREKIVFDLMVYGIRWLMVDRRSGFSISVDFELNEPTKRTNDRAYWLASLEYLVVFFGFRKRSLTHRQVDR